MSKSTDLHRLMRRHGLSYGRRDGLALTRKPLRKGYAFHRAGGARIHDPATIDRLNALAMPPAYTDVRYAANPKAHLQAVGIDAAGRPQYRYHPDWERIREQRKAGRLAEMVKALPRLKRAIARDLKLDDDSRAFAAAACVELVARTAIRAGSERYEQERGSRGATTLLKSNAHCEDAAIVLSFKGKGGKQVMRGARTPLLCAALARLKALPGRRLFQYRAADGAVCRLRAGDVNRYLKDIAGCEISLKDFRTLLASSLVAKSLAEIEPAASEAARRRQVKAAVADAAEELANTPTVCRKSYVHDSVVEAFEDGTLQKLGKPKRGKRAAPAELLAAIIAEAA